MGHPRHDGGGEGDQRPRRRADAPPTTRCPVQRVAARPPKNGGPVVIRDPYPFPVIVPVFVSAWEIDCCQPDATVGEEWTACLFLFPARPWWAREGEQASADPQLGLVDLEVNVVRPASTDESMALVDAGAIRLGVRGLRATGSHRLQGRVVSEWHGPDPEGGQLEEVACRGVVRRVRLVPVEYEPRGDRAWFPVAELPAVEVRSTAERRRGYADTGADRRSHDDLLVDLEVS